MPSHTPETPPHIALPLIQLDRATVVRSGIVALDNLSLSIEPGRHTALLGPNGCGKSSFIKLINRELHPLAREGESPIRLLGQTRWNTMELRRHLGVVTNDLARDLQEMHGLTAIDAVLTGFFASLVIPPDHEVTAQMITQAKAALERVDASALAGRPLTELSTGEARRVLIARALVHGPQALLLDEPTTGLDPVAQSHLISLMRELANQGVTLVLVTHHIEEIIPEIRRVILLRSGQVFMDGTPEQALTSENLSHTYGGHMKVERHGQRYVAHAEPPRTKS